MESYWVSAFFFPQGFMTASLQTYARQEKIAIDTLYFRTEVRPYHKEQITDHPPIGVNVHGLYLEGCRWN